MPKIKTNRSAAKRFKTTGTGKIVYHKSFGSHILSTKSRKRKRALRKNPIVHPKSNVKDRGVAKPLGRSRCTNCGRERVGAIGREIVEVASMDRTELSTPAFSRQAEIEVDQMFIGKMQSKK